MPGRAKFKPAWIVVPLIAALLTSGCASADHTWRGEFDARLEHARALDEETLVELGPDATKVEEFQSYAGLASALRRDGELLEGLDAPRACAEVQIKGLDHVESSGHRASEAHGPDYPARLLRADRVSLEKEGGVLTRVEREAATCA